MERRTKNIITPSSKEITCIYDDSSGLKETVLSQRFARMKNNTYYRFCRLKMLCVGVLNLEPTDIILEEEGESAIIYQDVRRVTDPSYCDAPSGNPPECAPARAWTSSFNCDVLIGGYESNRRLWYCSLILSSKNISSRSKPRAMARITTE